MTLLGNDFFDDAVQTSLVNDTDMENLRGLPQLRSLKLSNSEVTDAKLEHVGV